MSDIVLCTLNARYWHSAFGLRYLLSNMGALQSRTAMLEFGIKDDLVELLGKILQHQPRIVGFGVYIWNVEPLTRLVAQLRRVAPDVKIVLGGPEVSYETDGLGIIDDADYVIRGEADVAFAGLCQDLLDGSTPDEKWIRPEVPHFSELRLPYELYADEDIANRVIYVEASRGCPFSCEFCLSALEIPVRVADLDEFLSAMRRLLDRGALRFKFVDRTFNLNLRVGRSILEFFLDRYVPGLHLHFEMIPDRLPAELRHPIAQFPPGSLQFEIGVQTFNQEVSQRISRRQDNDKLAENFRFLRNHTGVHIHADLIVGLPGENMDSFGKGFDRLIELNPQEIQVGMLKRLRGTPITRHDLDFRMVYCPHAPYEVLQTTDIDHHTMQRLRRFARYWDLVGNSGNFTSTRDLIWSSGNPFDRFLAFSDWLFARENRAHGISLVRLSEHVFEFLQLAGVDEDAIARSIWRDYTGGGRVDKPPFLQRFDLPQPPARTAPRPGPPRQARHHAR